MICKSGIKHIFFILATVVSFSVAGHMGMLIESLYHDLAVSATVFGVSVTGIMSVLVKIYYICIS